VLLTEEVVELGEGGDAVGECEEAAEVELGVAEVEIAVGKQEGVAVLEVAAELEGGVVAAAGEGSLDGDGEAADGVVGGEETGAGWAAEGTAADQRRESADGYAGEVPLAAACASAAKDCSTSEAR
jgi:hypothetical protein